MTDTDRNEKTNDGNEKMSKAQLRRLLLWIIFCGAAVCALTLMLGVLFVPSKYERDYDADGDGYTNSGYKKDCDDKDFTIHPDAVEICDDGKDNDCDGYTDEYCPIIWCQDADEDDDGHSDVCEQQAGPGYWAPFPWRYQKGDPIPNCTQNDPTLQTIQAVPACCWGHWRWNDMDYPEAYHRCLGGSFDPYTRKLLDDDQPKS